MEGTTETLSWEGAGLQSSGKCKLNIVELLPQCFYQGANCSRQGILSLDSRLAWFIEFIVLALGMSTSTKPTWLKEKGTSHGLHLTFSDVHD